MSTENILVIVLVWLPFLGFLVNGFLALSNKPKIKQLSPFIGVFSITSSFFIVVCLTIVYSESIFRASGLEVHFFNWIRVSKLNINLAYLVDGLSIFMCWIITGIGALIHIYSIGYMAHDKEDQARFFAYLNLFIFSMLHLVLGDNLLVTFLGWEGVGLCSYLLIGFDIHKTLAAKAGKKAFITNRIGDAGFLIGMFIIMKYLGTLDYKQIHIATKGIFVTKELLNYIAFFLFIGAMGKSAQMPLSVWLPDAMAGPTPVSALIHAATMVTAGVFMIARMAPVFLGAVEVSTLIAYVGAFTALFAALIAITQTDIKKILAYSTVSQLGYMFLAMGVGAYGAGMFHLMTHAFFKALLFLGSGAVIVALHHEQDTRKMGGLYQHIKVIALIFWVGAIAISGIPGFSGFFSKDLILEYAYTFKNGGSILYVIGLLTAGLTSFYIYRLIFLTFHTSRDPQKGKVQDVGLSMKFPLIVLALLSIFGGYVGISHLLTHQPPEIITYFDKYLALDVSKYTHSWHHKISNFTGFILMFLSVLVAIVGFLVAFYRYHIQQKLPVSDGAYRTRWVRFSYMKFYVDEFYEKVILQPLKRLADFSYRILDVKWIDGFIDGFAEVGLFFSRKFANLQSGKISDYALSIIIATVLIGLMIMKGVL